VLERKSVSIALPEEHRQSFNHLSDRPDPPIPSADILRPDFSSLIMYGSSLVRYSSWEGRGGGEGVVRMSRGISACVGGNRWRWAGEYGDGSVAYRREQKLDRRRQEEHNRGNKRAGSKEI